MDPCRTGPTVLRESNAVMVANAFQLANSCVCFKDPEIAALYPNSTLLDLAIKAKKHACAARTADKTSAERLAKRALNLDPNCAEAYLVLAIHNDNWWTSKRMVRYGLQAAKLSLPPSYFEEPGQIGNFWHLLETRTYMIGLAMLADACYATRDPKEAIESYYEMLRLNPNDNLGARWMLAPLLVEVSRDAEAEALIGSYAEDYASTLAYVKALISFRRFGPDERSARYMREAIGRNPFVPVLFGDDKPPCYSDYFVVGEMSEADAMLISMRAAWDESPGSIEWLLELAQQVRIEQQAQAKRALSYKALKRGDYGRIVA